MSEIVERLKASIRDVAVPHEDPNYGARSLGYYLAVGIDHFPHDFARFEALLDLAARAAIAAIREPTEEMLESVGRDCVAWECFVGDGTQLGMAQVYSRLIDAALGGEG